MDWGVAVGTYWPCDAFAERHLLMMAGKTIGTRGYKARQSRALLAYLGRESHVSGQVVNAMFESS